MIWPLVMFEGLYALRDMVRVCYAGLYYTERESALYRLQGHLFMFKGRCVIKDMVRVCYALLY